ncbi:sodium-dependent transporter [Moheibacter lacus]|uniref:Sodium-dependent transporter n=1 Tax=Moheibacter lacus TaxID=2745851 RepID=A0A838ZQX4_9FLAO|nr:sodium-dependent transporter [Moheibacter lacus]MBA5629795.1 sodium-dependent transporter [Moheibacter lacus]
MSNNTASWGSRVGLILAMAGNAVGLGNFLRFPVQAVENGGGAFIIPYLICFLVMGIPLLFIEWSIGRYGGKFGNHSTPYILDTMAKGRVWKYIGVFGIFTNVAVICYYVYIESWTMSYVLHSVIGTFTGMSQAETAEFFNSYVSLTESTLGIPFEAVVFYIICLILNTYILSSGLKGIEKVAKIGMPMLIIFGAILAVKAFTLGDANASPEFPNANAWDGLNFLWTPQYESLLDSKVWLAAAGQVFFTLSVGMGTIHCYAAYVRSKDDIALNSVSAGFMNEFVEVVLGGAIVIPIAAGYLGLDWVINNAGFGMAFQTMPYLFQQWGQVLGAVGGVLWFGLLFFAGITSSLAMGTPWVGFMKDEFNWSQKKSAISFGVLVAIFGLPTVFFFTQGVFDEYDYWAGTISLVIFALLETIVFAWIFGINKGWNELMEGADIKITPIYKYIILIVTPLLLIWVFASNIPDIYDKITHKNIANKAYFSNEFYAEAFPNDNSENPVVAVVDSVSTDKKYLSLTFTNIKKRFDKTTETVVEETYQDTKVYQFKGNQEATVKVGDQISFGTPIAKGDFINTVLYLDIGRGLLLTLFVFLMILVYVAYRKRRREGRIFNHYS